MRQRRPGGRTDRCRYCSTHAARLTLPLVVMGIEPGGYQNEIRDAQAVRLRYRRGDFTFDDAELVHRILVGVAPLLEFDDGDQLLGADHPEPLSPRSGLRVISWIVASMSSGEWLGSSTINRSLISAHDEQLSVEEEAQITGSQPRSFGSPLQATEREALPLEGPLSVLMVYANSPSRRCRRAPRSHRPFCGGHSILLSGLTIRTIRRPWDPVADERGTVSFCPSARLADGELLGFEAEDLR